MLFPIIERFPLGRKNHRMLLCASQLMGAAAPKEGGKHEAEDFPEELLLGSQTAFDLDDEVIG